MQTLDQLNHEFGHDPIVRFDAGEGGLPRVVIETPTASAHVYLLGAHVTHYQRTGDQPLLFVSCRSAFAPDSPIRGGIPIVFPWFANRLEPNHGWARTRMWAVTGVACGDDDETATITFDTTGDGDATPRWPAGVNLRYVVTVGAVLRVDMTVENTTAQTFGFEQALHTYFHVRDVHDVAVTGLAGATFADKVDAGTRTIENDEPIRITGETDRVYLSTRSTCTIDDPGFGRRIAIEKTGSSSAVLWNPWIDKAAAMPDFGDDEWINMLCIEPGNLADNSVTIEPGKLHTMCVTYYTKSI